jgi:hypothetical protein
MRSGAYHSGSSDDDELNETLGYLLSNLAVLADDTHCLGVK